MTVKANNHIVLTGNWPDKKTVAAFFSAAGTSIQEGQAFQLFQTYSKCSLERFNVNIPIDIGMIEQYRAFCPAWELWIRNINAKELRFRFIAIGMPNVNVSVLTEKGYTVENKTDVITGMYIETVSYPLWGKALPKGENHDAGWYTTEIPKIIQYPVNEAWEKVALTVQNFIRQDGTVEMVRYTELTEGKV